MATENLVDVVEQLQQIVNDFKRILYGDQAARTDGLLVEFNLLRKEVHELGMRVDQLQARRPHVWAWICGYVAFMAATVFGVVAIINRVEGHDVWHLAPELATWVALGCAGFALLLFLIGFGWFDG